jgi:hypothetical protein
MKPTTSELDSEIEGEAIGRKFAVSSWPKPRFSNPHFLTDLLADMESDTRKVSTNE